MEQVQKWQQKTRGSLQVPTNRQAGQRLYDCLAVTIGTGPYDVPVLLSVCSWLYLHTLDIESSRLMLYRERAMAKAVPFFTTRRVSDDKTRLG